MRAGNHRATPRSSLLFSWRGTSRSRPEEKKRKKSALISSIARKRKEQRWQLHGEGGGNGGGEATQPRSNIFEPRISFYTGMMDGTVAKTPDLKICFTCGDCCCVAKHHSDSFRGPGATGPKEVTRQIISAFSRRLKHNSYAIILLPEKIAEDVVNTQKELQRYFRSTGLEDKHKHTLDANDFRYGYWFSPKMGKELFQICLMALGGFLCRSQSARNANVSRRERDSKSDGVEAASSVPSLSSSKEGACFWRNLCKGCTPQDFPLSASLLDIFRYYGAPARGADSCSAHTDYNLLTLVPRALGKAGLEVFGWKSGEWEPVEACAPKTLHQYLTDYRCLSPVSVPPSRSFRHPHAGPNEELSRVCGYGRGVATPPDRQLAQRLYSPRRPTSPQSQS
eukprot:jgi/Bigna1/82519/fgenesh1_pg.93_\